MSASVAEIWLIDVSASMTGGRYERLKDHLKVLHAASPHVKLIAFSTVPVEINNIGCLPHPGGGTALHLALDAALPYFPGKVVVFSDGCPNDKDAAILSASALPGVVGAVFFGDDTDGDAKAFMERLARENGGRWVFKDILKDETLLCGEVRELLGLPAPIAL